MSATIATELHSKLQTIFDSEWNLTQNTANNIVYTSTSNTFEEFRITIENARIKVAVPMPNSEVLYKTNLQTSEEVCDYIQTHLDHLRTHLENLNNSETDSNSFILLGLLQNFNEGHSEL